MNVPAPRIDPKKDSDDEKCEDEDDHGRHVDYQVTVLVGLLAVGAVDFVGGLVAEEFLLGEAGCIRSGHGACGQ